MNAASPASELFKDVLRFPADDYYRLVYADVLEGAEPERACFIRLQCELARMWACPECGRGSGGTVHDTVCETCEKREAMERREKELFLHGDARGPCGLPPVAMVYNNHLIPNETAHEIRDAGISDALRFRLVWSRGFVSSVTCAANDFLSHAAALFSAQPVTEVRLGDKKPHHIHGYSWFTPSTHAQPAELPLELYLHLIDEDKPNFNGNRWVSFDTEREAMGALSAACVRFGRLAAGLPV